MSAPWEWRKSSGGWTLSVDTGPRGRAFHAYDVNDNAACDVGLGLMAPARSRTRAATCAPIASRSSGNSRQVVRFGRSRKARRTSMDDHTIDIGHVHVGDPDAINREGTWVCAANCPHPDHQRGQEDQQ